MGPRLQASGREDEYTGDLAKRGRGLKAAITQECAFTSTRVRRWIRVLESHSPRRLCNSLQGIPKVLQLEGLRRRYGNVVALDDLSFEVPSGLVVGFLGPNGAGKTTTMRAIFGLTDLEAGVVRWDGAPVDQATRRRFGYMPEERGLYPGMRVGEQLEYLGRLHGLSTADAANATQTWLERLEIADRRDSKVETLSHGNQQRVQLAAALLHQPELLVLDEPLSGLDPSGIDAIGRVLVDQANAGGCVVFSSHQLDQVEDLCERVTIIDHGRLVVSGTVDELATSGARRLVVRIDGHRDADWVRSLPGVTVSEMSAGAIRLVLDSSVDSDDVLRAAMGVGHITEFSFERRRLSEVFREALV
jgi:ABC-2 type transport system ATP-binding protein